MKIVMAVHHFPPRYGGGAELRAYRTAVWLQDHGHDMHVVCTEAIDVGDGHRLTFEDDTDDGLSIRRLSFNLSAAPDLFRWSYDNPWIEKHLRDYLAELEPDIFHLIGGYLLGAGALRAAQVLGIPTVVTLTDFWFLCPRITLVRTNDEHCTSSYILDAADCTRCQYEEKRRFRLPARLFPGVAEWFWAHILTSSWGDLLGAANVAEQFRRRERVLLDVLSTTGAIVCPTPLLVERFRLRGVDSSKLTVNVHGLDCSSWLPVPAADKQDHVFRIGYMGQIVSHKGVHLLIEAFKRLPSASPLELVIYGNETAFPSYTARLRKLARGDSRIKIEGRYEYPRVAQILASIDVLVVPSIWHEIGPWVMYEALQTKTPVVASDMPNMSYVVQHERNGLLFTCGSTTDLAAQLQRLVDDPDLVARLRDNITPVRSLTEEMTKLQEVYHRSVGGNEKSPLASFA
jgi:glycosyltransferase involved in cell wall biosynthesis